MVLGYSIMMPSLISSSSSSNSKKSRGSNSNEMNLVRASSKGDYETIEKMLLMLEKKKKTMKTKKRFNTKKNKVSSLMVPVIDGKDDVDVLVDLNINYQDYDGLTALHHACMNDGYIKIIELLVKYNANMEVQDNEGNTPLSLACMNGNIHAIKVLLFHKANMNCQNNYGYTPLYMACNNGQMDVVRTLLQHGADWNKTTYSGNYSPLRAAILTEKIHNYSLGIVQLLLSYNKNKNKNKKNNSNQIRIDSKDDSGRTPLHWACYTSSVLGGSMNISNIVELLIQNGASIYSKDINGDTPFHFACKLGNTNIIELFIRKYNMNMNVVNNEGNTPLHIACIRNEISTIELLLQYGASIYVKNKYSLLPQDVIVGSNNNKDNIIQRHHLYLRQRTYNWLTSGIYENLWGEKKRIK